MDVHDFAVLARRAADIACGIWAAIVVVQAALYNAGVHHSDGGNTMRAVLVVANAIGCAAWVILRPVF